MAPSSAPAHQAVLAVTGRDSSIERRHRRKYWQDPPPLFAAGPPPPIAPLPSCLWPEDFCFPSLDRKNRGHTLASVGGTWEGSWGRTGLKLEALATSWQAASPAATQTKSRLETSSRPPVAGWLGGPRPGDLGGTWLLDRERGTGGEGEACQGSCGWAQSGGRGNQKNRGLA